MKLETQVLVSLWAPSLLASLTISHSPIRRVHPSEHQAILHAQRHRSRSIGRRELRPGRASEEFEVAQTVHGQFAARGNGSDHEEAEPLLAGLSSGAGTFAVCCTWLCSVCVHFVPPGSQVSKTASYSGSVIVGANPESPS